MSFITLLTWNNKEIILVQTQLYSELEVLFMDWKPLSERTLPIPSSRSSAL